MVVICIWCALFVTSQFDVIFMFPNQRFGGVCWHNRHILLQALPCFMCHCAEYKLSALHVRMSGKINSTLRQAVHNCKKIRLRVETGSKTHSSVITTSEQFTAAKWGCPNVSSNTSSRVQKVAAGLAGTHPGLQDRIMLKYTRIENAHKVRKKTLDFLLCIEVQQIFSFFSLLRHHQMPECFYFNNCCFRARTTVL